VVSLDLFERDKSPMTVVRFRFTLRRLMAVVAACGVALALLVASERWLAWISFCEKNAASHRTSEEHFDLMVSGHSFSPPGGEVKARQFVSDYRKIADFHASMREKWEEAKLHPWTPVPSDPPAPGP
jgi:hypothetical protein